MTTIPGKNTSTIAEPEPAGSFILGDQLGEGFLGTTLEALDQATQAKLTFKILSNLQSQSPSDIRDLERQLRHELERLSALAVPHTKIPLAVSMSDNQLVLVSEYIAGTPFSSILAQQEVLPPALAIEILLPIARCLDAVHKAGCIHGHLSPHDIMVPERGTSSLRDLGSSSAVPHGRNPESLNRLPYLAAEILRGEAASAASDRYTFVAITFRALTGVTAVQGKTAHEYRDRILTGNRLLAATVNPKLSLAASAIFEESLATTPSDRPASLCDFLSRLANALQLGDISNIAGSVPLSFRLSRGASSSSTTLTKGSSVAATNDAAGVKARWQETISERGHISGPTSSSAPKTPGDLFSVASTASGGAPVRRRPAKPKQQLSIWVFLAAGAGATVLTIVALLTTNFLGNQTEASAPMVLTAEEAFPEFRPPAAPPPPKHSELIAALNEEELLGLIGDPNATVPQLNEALSIARDRRIGDLSLHILPLLRHGNLVIRLAAAHTLALIKDRRAAPELMNFIDDSDPALRGAVAEALAQIGDRRALEYLKLRYTKEKSPDMRLVMKRAIETLSAMPFEEQR